MFPAIIDDRRSATSDDAISDRRTGACVRQTCATWHVVKLTHGHFTGTLRHPCGLLLLKWSLHGFVDKVISVLLRYTAANLRT